MKTRKNEINITCKNILWQLFLELNGKGIMNVAFIIPFPLKKGTDRK